MKGGYKRCKMFDIEKDIVIYNERLKEENAYLKKENQLLEKDNKFAREQVFKYIHETTELDNKCFEKSNRIIELLKEVKDWKTYTIASLSLMCVLVVCLMICIAYM